MFNNNVEVQQALINKVNAVYDDILAIENGDKEVHEYLADALSVNTNVFEYTFNVEITIGGPNIWIEGEFDNEWMTIYGTWNGSETVEVKVEAGAIGEYISELLAL